MKIVVISLQSALSRRARITEQLDKLELEFEFLDGVLGTPEMYNLANYKRAWRYKFWGGDLTVGEIGCYKSHQLACKRAADLNEPVLVLEDDLLINVELKDFLTALDSEIEQLGFDILRISGLFPKPYYTIKDGSFQFIKYLKHPHGTQGYVIKPDAAKKYLRYLEDIRLPIDDAMDNDFAHGLTIYGYLPYLVEHDYGVGSDIGERKKKKIGYIIKCNKQLLRSWWSSRRLIWNVKNYLYDRFILRRVIK